MTSGHNALFDALTSKYQTGMESMAVELNNATSITSGADASYEIIGHLDAPTTHKWALVELRKKDLKGATRMWQIGFNPDRNELITWHGHVGGKSQIEHDEVTLNQSGKNMLAQALLQARQKYKLKLHDGYIPPGSNKEPMINIMSAEAYDPAAPVKLNFPVSMETKLDGMRIWIRRCHGVIEGYSRGNIQFFTMKHIFIECNELFDYLPYNSAIDCEMFHPELSFQELTSIGRTQLSTHQLMPMLELYIFDLYTEDNPPFEIRRRTLESAVALYRYDKFGYTNDKEPMVGGRHALIADPRTKADFTQIPIENYPTSAVYPNTTKIFLTILYQVFSYEQIQQLHDYFVSMKYEGSMIKRHANGAGRNTNDYISSQYLFGRGNNILKFKYKKTDEGVCIGVNEGKGREKGCAVLVLRAANGREFSVRMKGGLDRRREIYKNKHMALGKPVTYEYQDLTDDGVPRFPVGVEIRDYEPGFQMM